MPRICPLVRSMRGAARSSMQTHGRGCTRRSGPSETSTSGVDLKPCRLTDRANAKAQHIAPPSLERHGWVVAGLDPGRVKTKSNLVVALSGGGIFAYFCSERDHKPQNSGCGYTA
jgi:hypothetical protein